MKTLNRLLNFAIIATALFLVIWPACTSLTGCANTPPASRVVQVQTLKTIGQTAETTVAVSARMYQAGEISPAQAYKVMRFYDDRFQVAFRAAVFAAKSDLDTLASPEVIALAQQLSALLTSFNKRTP